MNKLAKEIAIESNCFTYNNVLYERLYSHSHKYRFFFVGIILLLLIK